VSFIPWPAWAGLFGLVLAGAFWWWLTRTLRKQGAMQRDLDASRTNEKVKDAQLEAANNRPRDRAELLDRVRDGL
jgi:hypothetical protein